MFSNKKIEKQPYFHPFGFLMLNIGFLIDFALFSGLKRRMRTEMCNIQFVIVSVWQISENYYSLYLMNSIEAYAYLCI